MSNRTLCNWSKSKKVGMFFRKKKSQKLNRIENNPLAMIVTFLTIYHKLILLMIDVVPITPWDLFKKMCTGKAVAEFNSILFKASGKTFEFTKANFNEKIYITDENSD